MEYYTVSDYTILGLAVIFFISWWVLWFIHVAALFHASRRLYRYTVDNRSSVISVTIIKKKLCSSNEIIMKIIIIQ